MNKLFFETYKYLNESIIFNSKDIKYKFDDWISGKNKVLLITGLLGSGKSTLGQQIANKYKAKFISLDIKEYQDSDVVKKLIDNTSSPTVYESSLLMEQLTPEEASHYSVILLGVSYLISTFRATMRDTDNKPWKGDALMYFLKTNKEFYKYFKQYYNYFKDKK